MGVLGIAATLVALIPFYALGCFPTGWLVARVHGIDITQEGSGNVGATNISRVIGKRAGILTLIGDVGKGALAVGLAQLFSPVEWYVAGAGVAVVCGHCFSIPPWLKGGKGVATALGAILMVFPIGALIALLSFGLVFAVSKTVSVASLASATLVPLYSLLTNQSDARSIALVVIACVIVLRHKQNIVRLIEGREPTFSSRRDRSS